jgi:hypothetical protein
MSRFRAAAAAALLALALIGGAVATAVPATGDALAQGGVDRTPIGYYTTKDGKLCIIYRVMYLDGPREGQSEIDIVCRDLRG